MQVKFLRNLKHTETGKYYREGEVAEVPDHAAIFWQNSRAVEPVTPELETATVSRSGIETATRRR